MTAGCVGIASRQACKALLVMLVAISQFTSVLTAQASSAMLLPEDVLTEGACIADAPIECGSNVSDTTLGGAAVLSSYKCGSPSSGIEWPGPERVYSFTPQATGEVDVLLDSEATDADLYVLESACLVGNCVTGATNASPMENLQFQAVAGTQYFLVVESDPSAAFELSVSAGTSGCPEGCNNGLDDDLDGDVDCDDADCANSAACDATIFLNGFEL